MVFYERYVILFTYVSNLIQISDVDVFMRLQMYDTSFFPKSMAALIYDDTDSIVIV